MAGQVIEVQIERKALRFTRGVFAASATGECQVQHFGVKTDCLFSTRRKILHGLVDEIAQHAPLAKTRVLEFIEQPVVNFRVEAEIDIEPVRAPHRASAALRPAPAPA